MRALQHRMTTPKPRARRFCPNRLFCLGENLSLDVTGVKGSGVLVLEGESQCGEYSAPELGCLAK